MILALRTDSDEATIILLNHSKIDQRDSWQAGRQLSSQLVGRIQKLLEKSNSTWEDLSGVVVYKGPGSFTGLRIGITVANTIAYAKNIPIVGTQCKDWATAGASLLQEGHDDKQVVPFYGAEPNITKPRGAP